MKVRMVKDRKLRMRTVRNMKLRMRNRDGNGSFE